MQLDYFLNILREEWYKNTKYKMLYFAFIQNTKYKYNIFDPYDEFLIDDDGYFTVKSGTANNITQIYNTTRIYLPSYFERNIFKLFPEFTNNNVIFTLFCKMKGTFVQNVIQVREGYCTDRWNSYYHFTIKETNNKLLIVLEESILPTGVTPYKLVRL